MDKLPDPADVAARLRRCIAEHDAIRRTRASLIRRLDAYSRQLKLQNMEEGVLVGRLRRMCAHYDADARRLASNTRLRRAA